jgi:hypothetical protein
MRKFICYRMRYKEAEQYLQGDSEADEHLEKVRNVIQGFETPYGMELLSTVHWVVKENPDIKDDVHSIIEEIHNWNERKRKIFKEKHITKAWQHLKGIGMLN